MHARIPYLLLIGFLLLCCPPARAQDKAEESLRAQNDAPALEWVELALAGRTTRINAGGVMSLHPDTPFKFLKARTTAWLNFGITAWLASHPNVDVTQYHSLNEILGDAAANTDHVDLKVFKDNVEVGGIRIIIRFLPIDWVRKANAADTPEQKIAYIKRALELTPDDALLRKTLLSLLLEAHQYDQAAKMLEAGLAEEYNLENARRLAEIYMQTDQPRRAAATLSKLSARMPRDAELLEQLADLYLRQDSKEEALNALARLADLKRGSAKAGVLLQIADIQKSLGRQEQMLASLEKAAKLAPADPTIWALLAEALSASEEKDKALYALKKAVALNPSDSGLRWSLAESLLASQDYTEALTHLERLAQEENTDPRVWVKLAEVYQGLDRRDQLPQVYEHLKRMNPEDPDLAYNLGLLQLEQGEYAKARENLELVKKARPGDIATAKLLFEAYCGQEEWELALAEAEHILGLEPANPETVASFSRCLRAKRPEYLGALLDIIIQGKPDFFLPYEIRAAQALDQGDNDLAIAALEKASRAMPRDIGIMSQLALLYEAENRDKEALAMYEEILDQDPDNAKAGEKYLLLKTRLLDQEDEAGIDEPEDPLLKEAPPAP